MSNKKRVFLILVFLSVLFTYKTRGQNNPYNEVSISSPNAASLGKYADVPVSYHTGIPQISIPIYNVKEGPLSLPISISYHASGLKVMEPASWVGAGWSLNAGGVITRTVQGAPDERNTSSVDNQTHGHLSESGYNKYFLIPTGAPPQEPPSWAPKYEMQDWANFAQGKKDGEPDLFFFNFAGFSGKFYFHDDGSAVLVPEQDIKVEYNYTPGSGKSIESFTITTPDGTKYYFGKTASTLDIDPIEKTNPFNSDAGLTQGTVISSWYLNKIVSVDGLFSITLNYAAENYSYYTISMFPVPYDNNQSPQGYKSVKNMMTGIRLSQVIFSNGKVDFIPSTVARLDLNGNTLSFVNDVNTEAKSLDSIKISNNSGTSCKKFILSYNYFEDNSSVLPSGLAYITTDRKRLKLNSLQEQSCDGSVVIPAHLFEYSTELVPRRLSFAQDHWGFYNGATGNNTMIPTYTIDQFTTVYGANRDASWPAMKGGSMKKITYPTGGYSEFEFEQNYTWVNYSNLQWAFPFGHSAGYGGTDLPVIQYYPFTSNSYRLTFSNLATGSQAFLSIYNSNNVEVEGYVLEPGTNFSEILQFSPGTYRVELKKLNPSSGYGTQVSFEEWVAVPIQKNETVGGLRIKKLTVNDGILASNNIITSYTYETAAKSTGILYSRPVYVYKIRNDLIRDIGYQAGPACNPEGCTDCNGYAYLKSPNGIRPMETTQGNHIGYNDVRVSQTGNGFSTYRYYGSNVWDVNTNDVASRSINPNSGICESSITNFPFVPLPHEFMRGELKYEGHFNESGQLLKESEYYPVFQNNPKTTPAFIASVNPINGTSYLGTFYTISTAKKTQTEVIQRINIPGAGVMQTSNYSYFESSYHNQVTRNTNTSSTGQTIETKVKYAVDFRIPACDAISDCLQSYNTDVSAALNLFNSRKFSCADHTCRWWAWQAYIKDLSIARSNFVTCRKTNYTGSANSFNSCLISNRNAADSWLKPILDLQLQFNNPPIETTNWRSAKLLNASFNKFDYATVPSTQQYLNKILSIGLVTPSTTFTPANLTSNSITKDSRYKDETTTKFYNGNLVELTPKNGVTTSYIWAYNNVLPVVKAVGIDHNTLKSAYDAVSGNLSLLRNQSSLNAALVDTYVYDPFIGMTSETNPNNRNGYYEYDKLQRLVLVRDHNNNILKKICYGYNGQSGNCGGYPNEPKSGTFTRNNCQSGYTGSQYTYIVPAGTYTSPISQLDANTTAQNDVNANGQNKANENGTCTGPPVTIMGYNTKTTSYRVIFTSNSTDLQYTFSLNPNTYSPYTLGQIPAGTYSVQFSPAGSPLTATFNINGYIQSGQSATFSNISITTTSTASMY